MGADDKASDLVQGTLDMLILKTLALEPMHGYGIGVRLEQISKGVFRVNAGSLFLLAPSGTRRPDQGRVARHREQPAREVLQHHRPGTRHTQTRDTRLGRPDHRNRQDSEGVAVTPLLARFIGGLNALLRRGRAEQDLDEELRAYLETSVEEHMRAGMAREDAIRAARVEFGSLDAVKDHTRHVGWEGGLESLCRDVRYAAKTLRKAPAFTGVAVLTLALGHRRQHRDLRCDQCRHAAAASGRAPTRADLTGDRVPGRCGAGVFHAAYRQFAAEGARVADAIAASSVRRDVITIDGPPETVDPKWVSGNYFTTLGVPAAIGRTLLPSDDRPPPGDPVAVLSDGFLDATVRASPVGHRPHLPA